MLHIRPATAADCAALTRLAVETFTDTFAEVNTPENMAAYLAECLTEPVIAQELADLASQYFLAHWGDALVGYLKLRTGEEPPELAERPALEIQRLYVLRAFHQHKIGYALMQHAFAEAKEQGMLVLWLGVWEENPRAIAFYQRVGFEVFGTHVFVLGEDVQKDFLMKMRMAGG